MATRIQVRRGTNTQWNTTDPILNIGEFGYSTTDSQFKIGDGATIWSELDYVPSASSLGSSLGDYIELIEKSAADGVAELDGSKNILAPAGIIFEGTANDFETTLSVTDPTADRTITLPNVTGTVITTGNLSDITNIGVFSSTITMEGSTADAYELTLSAGDPTADRTITFPDETGTVQLRVTDVSDTEIGYLNGVTSAIQTQLDTKLASATAATTYAPLASPALTGNATAVNLTLSGDLTVNGTTTTVNSNAINVNNQIIFEGATANAFETTLTVVDPTADRTITFPDTTGTVALTSDITTHGNLTEAHGATGAVVGTTNTQTLTNKTLTSPVINTPTGITKSDVGLSNVDNTTDAGKPVSTATQTALDLKAPLASPTFTGTVTLPSGTVTSAMIADGTIANADINASAAIALSKLATDPLARANHTGSQTASTISDFNEAAQDAVGGILGSGLTYTDASNTITVDSSVVQLRVANITDTEIGYLDGVTSAIQTQLNDKAPLASPTFTGTVSAAALTLSGNLTVNGTTTTINSTTLSVDDKNVVLGDIASPTDVTADGGGITLKGTTDKTLNWVDATDAWTSSEHMNLLTGKSYKINNTAISAALPALTWGDVKNGKSGLAIS